MTAHDQPVHLHPHTPQLVWRVAKYLSPGLLPWLAGALFVLAFGLLGGGCDASQVAVPAVEAQDAAGELDAPALPALATVAPATDESATEPEGQAPEAGPAMDPRVDPNLVAYPPSLAPPGFPAKDRFTSTSEACVQLTKELAHEYSAMERRAIYDYCEWRGWSSSRNNVIKSQVDGSQIHDRDRPVAWRFYNRGLISGTLDPDNCPHHAIDESVKHSRAERRLAENWPYKNGCVSFDSEGKKTCSKKTPGELAATLKDPWLDQPADKARFGTRGAHDNNLPTAQFWLPGCYPPEALDRRDVNVSITIIRSMAICDSFGCPNKQAIKRRWRNGPTHKVRKAWRERKRQ